MKQGKIEMPDGEVHYYQDDKLHREGGPALIRGNGTTYYYQNGKRHREDGPAILHKDGEVRWYQNGLLHREDGPAMVYNDGCSFYYLKGLNMTKNDYYSSLKEKYIKENPVKLNFK